MLVQQKHRLCIFSSLRASSRGWLQWEANKTDDQSCVVLDLQPCCSYTLGKKKKKVEIVLSEEWMAEF